MRRASRSKMVSRPGFPTSGERVEPERRAALLLHTVQKWRGSTPIQTSCSKCTPCASTARPRYRMQRNAVCACAPFGRPRKALRGGIQKSIIFQETWVILAKYDHNEEKAPRTRTGYPHDGPFVASGITTGASNADSTVNTDSCGSHADSCVQHRFLCDQGTDL